MFFKITIACHCRVDPNGTYIAVLILTAPGQQEVGKKVFLHVLLKNTF